MRLGHIIRNIDPLYGTIGTAFVSIGLFGISFPVSMRYMIAGLGTATLSVAIEPLYQIVDQAGRKTLLQIQGVLSIVALGLYERSLWATQQKKGAHITPSVVRG